MRWTNSTEREKVESGEYEIFSLYNDKETCVKVQEDIKKDNIRCFRAHHYRKTIHPYDVWVLYVNIADYNRVQLQRLEQTKKPKI